MIWRVFRNFSSHSQRKWSAEGLSLIISQAVLYCNEKHPKEVVLQRETSKGRRRERRAVTGRDRIGRGEIKEETLSLSPPPPQEAIQGACANDWTTHMTLLIINAQISRRVDPNFTPRSLEERKKEKEKENGVLI